MSGVKDTANQAKNTSSSRTGLVGTIATVAVAMVVVAVVVLSAQAIIRPASPVQASPLCSPYQPLDPVAGGVVRSVGNQGELEQALVDAKPGDVINLKTATYSKLSIRKYLGHSDGTAEAPIVVQAAEGAHPTFNYGAVNDPGKEPVVDVANRSHWKVRGFEVRERTFGMRAANAHHITFEYNDVHSVGYVGIVAQAFYADRSNTFSSDVTIRCNRVHGTGLQDPEFGEGIYVGTGSVGYTDRTTGVLIEYNEIFDGTNEAVDIKRYSTDVTVANNLIHDVTPWYGGAVSVGLNKANYPSGNYRVESNQIWNVTTGKYYAQAIAVAHGETVIRNNTIWNINTLDTPDTPWTSEIQVHGDSRTEEWAYGFGNPNATRVVIAENNISGCSKACISSYTAQGMILPDLLVENNTVSVASSGAAANPTDIIIVDTPDPETGDQTGGGTGEQTGSGEQALATTTDPSSTTPSPPGSEPQPNQTVVTTGEPPGSGGVPTGPAPTSEPVAPPPTAPIAESTVPGSTDPIGGSTTVSSAVPPVSTTVTVPTVPGPEPTTPPSVGSTVTGVPMPTDPPVESTTVPSTAISPSSTTGKPTPSTVEPTPTTVEPTTTSNPGPTTTTAPVSTTTTAPEQTTTTAQPSIRGPRWPSPRGRRPVIIKPGPRQQRYEVTASTVRSDVLALLQAWLVTGELESGPPRSLAWSELVDGVFVGETEAVEERPAESGHKRFARVGNKTQTSPGGSSRSSGSF